MPNTGVFYLLHGSIIIFLYYFNLILLYSYIIILSYFMILLLYYHIIIFYYHIIYMFCAENLPQRQTLRLSPKSGRKPFSGGLERHKE